MIYTTYFAKLNKLPNNIIPISICAKAPSWYKGLQYKKLAPKYDFFMEWKQTHDNDYYVKCFNEQVLNGLNPQRVIHELMDLAENEAYANFGYSMSPESAPELALVCYEKPSDFCHRHLVAKWLRDNGYDCKELNI